MITDFHDLRVTVMGLGTFGGGIGATRFLVRQGARVTVTDLRSADALKASISVLNDANPARWRLGGHHPDDFEQSDLIVVSPAVPRDNPWLNLARRAGVSMTSEMNLFWERNPGRVIGVTGSNGKSTTTAMIHTLLSQALLPRDGDNSEFPVTLPSPNDSGSAAARLGPVPRVWLGGNIGQSLLPLVHEIEPRDWVVLELSSFQLEDLAPLRPNPQVAVVTNFSPNHLDRHGAIENYRQAKQQLLRWQTSDRLAVLNCDDSEVSCWQTSARVVGFGLRDYGTEGLFSSPTPSNRGMAALFRFSGKEQFIPIQNWLTLPGEHNLRNALAASAVALSLGVDHAGLESGLRRFQGLAHRLELVADLEGRRFYNDSKATTPEAAMLALQSFNAPIVLLAGGYDKEVELTTFASAIVDRSIRAVALLGQTGPRMAQLLSTFDRDRRVARQVFSDFSSAFEWAAAQSAPGDVVLLSPGCASYDWFENYEERGRMFRSLVLNWPRRNGANVASTERLSEK